MWLCAMENYPGSLRLTLTCVGRDLIPEIMARRSWRRPAAAPQVLAGLDRWERAFSISIENIVVERFEYHPFGFLRDLQPRYPVVSLEEGQLDGLLEAWRQRDRRSPWPRHRAGWICVLGAARRGKPRTEWEWVLLGLRSQVRALERFVAEQTPVDRDGDMVYLPWPD